MAILASVAGGFARILNTKGKRKVHVGRVLVELAISAFIGWMALLLARISGLTGDWLGLVCGIAGWIGPRMLDLIAKPAVKPLGIEMDEDKKKEEV